MGKLTQTIMIFLTMGLGLFLFRPAGADTLYLTDKTVLKDIVVMGFRSPSTMPVPVFEYLKVDDQGKVTGNMIRIDSTRVRAVEFEDPSDQSATAKGKIAHIYLPDLSVIRNYVVLRGQIKAERYEFEVHKADSAPGEELQTISHTQIERIDFGPYALNLNPGGSESGLKKIYAGKKRVQNTSKKPVGAANPAKNNFMDDPYGINSVYGENSPLLEDPEEEKPESSLGAALVAVGIPLMGTLAIFGIIGIVLTLNFILGIFVLLFSAKNEGVGDLTIPRAIATSALLSYIPPGVVVSIMMIPFPLHSVKLIAGIFAFWFISRFIVMGMLEVLEQKATDVLITYYLLFILALIGLWIYAITFA